MYKGVWSFVMLQKLDVLSRFGCVFLLRFPSYPYTGNLAQELESTVVNMKIATLLAFGSVATALPNLFSRTKNYCLTQERAEYIVSRERVYLQKANLADAQAAGEELFSTDSFVQYSDSINSLRGDPVSPDFKSLTLS